MSQFINPTDYDATVHREILDALTRQDAAIIDICEERAISEMKSYLAPVYDVEAVFGARGEERHPLVLMMALDIAVYHIFCIHNPQKLSSIRQDSMFVPKAERVTIW
ncbi:MAG: DUF1320 family protein [Bacteroidaceae bacterium]|nr:DUF1320 family protein [Bacteroidaceae bacterium]